PFLIFGREVARWSDGSSCWISGCEFCGRFPEGSREAREGDSITGKRFRLGHPRSGSISSFKLGIMGRLAIKKWKNQRTEEPTQSGRGRPQVPIEKRTEKRAIN